MDKRLQQFLSAENITQAQFADEIGVARASVSHILAGRNKPGFDFITSMSQHFPDLSLEWLISGRGKMYKSTAAGSSSTPVDMALSAAPESALPTAVEHEPESEAASVPQKSANAEAKPHPQIQKKLENKEIEVPHISENFKPDTRTISQIIVFFSDGTYQLLK